MLGEGGSATSGEGGRREGGREEGGREGGREGALHTSLHRYKLHLTKSQHTPEKDTSSTFT